MNNQKQQIDLINKTYSQQILINEILKDNNIIEDYNINIEKKNLTLGNDGEIEYDVHIVNRIKPKLHVKKNKCKC